MKQVIVFTVPATMAGVLLGRVFPAFILQSMLALLLFYLAYQFLLKGKKCLPKDPRCTGISATRVKEIVSPITKGTSFLGGLLVGMISAGLGIKTLFIEPGSPWENGYIESFNGKLRDELRNREIFTTLTEAKVLIEQWRQEYNHVRPHSALRYRPPAPEARIPVIIPVGLT